MDGKYIQKKRDIMIPESLRARLEVAKHNVFINEPHTLDHERAFLEGAEALHEMLMQSAPEFDHAAFQDWSVADSSLPSAYTGARWQHSQMIARESALRAQHEEKLHTMANAHLDAEMSLIRERDAALARVAELEKLVSIAKDCLEQCANQGKMMPGEYDTFLDALARSEK